MKKATIGTIISFTRNNHIVEGKVVKINENSVIVEISDKDRIKINYPSNMTIVNHKNYHIK